MKPEANKNQGWKNILALIIPYFLVVGIFVSIAMLITGLDWRNIKSASTKQLFVINLFNLTGTLLIVWLFTKYVDKKSFSSLCFKKSFYKQDILLGIVIGFSIMFLGFIWLILSHQIEFLSINSNLLDLMLSIVIFILVALSEEILFRGYILSNLMASFNKFIALIISAFLFSLMHSLIANINFIGLLNIFLSGLIFGVAYIYSKSLWFPIALHFSWNFFQGPVFGFNVSGRDTYSLLNTNADTANIWNGGSFGFEGSILSVLFQLIALFIVFIIFKSRATGEIFSKETKATGKVDFGH